MPKKSKKVQHPKKKSKQLRNFERSFHSVERVDWIRSLKSVASGRTPCVNAHVKTGGTGIRADYKWIVPLTHEEHMELHQHGHKTFERKWNVDLLLAARAVQDLWQLHSEREYGD